MEVGSGAGVTETLGSPKAYGGQQEVFMFEILGLMALGALTYAGYSGTRRFVRERLRYVDAAQRRYAPWLAGLATATLAIPLTWVLPFVGAGTAILFGIGVGLGVSRGAADVRRMRGAGGDWMALPRI